MLSSTWIEAFQDDELSFIIGRQLGHIAMGHARYNSLLSVNGRENPFIAAIFGAWLRRCELTCDRVGLLCCGSLDAAMRAIAVEAFHHFGRRIDLSLFAQQNAEITGDPVLRWGQWLSGEPYATTRIERMRQFMQTHQYEVCEEWFLRPAATNAPTIAAAGKEVTAADCSGWWRRLVAVGIDFTLVFLAARALDSSANDVIKAAAAQTPVQQNVVHLGITSDDDETPEPTHSPRASASPRGPIVVRIATPSTAPSASPAPSATPTKTPYYINTPGGRVNLTDLEDRNGNIALTFPVMFAILLKGIGPFWFFIYCAVLVGTAGQTFGMMITGLRVVRIDYQRPGFAHALWRYIIVLTLGWLSVLLSPWQRRIMLHDRISGTRLIRAERALQRNAQPDAV